MSHAAEAEIDCNRRATARDLDEHPGTRRLRPRDIPVEEIIVVASTAVFEARIAPEQRRTRSHETVETDRPLPDGDLWTKCERADLGVGGHAVALIGRVVDHIRAVDAPPEERPPDDDEAVEPIRLVTGPAKIAQGLCDCESDAEATPIAMPYFAQRGPLPKESCRHGHQAQHRHTGPHIVVL